jgi:outer membrane biosynthesis protein TonB
MSMDDKKIDFEKLAFERAQVEARVKGNLVRSRMEGNEAVVLIDFGIAGTKKFRFTIEQLKLHVGAPTKPAKPAKAEKSTPPAKPTKPAKPAKPEKSEKPKEPEKPAEGE